MPLPSPRWPGEEDMILTDLESKWRHFKDLRVTNMTNGKSHLRNELFIFSKTCERA